MAAFRRKRGNRDSGDSAPGEDSFLDIVANIVGILIILVMVAGVRVGSAPVAASSAQAEAENAANGARAEIDRLAAAMDDARVQLASATATHDELAQSRDSTAATVASLREQLDGASTLDPELAQLESELDERRGMADELGDELQRMRKTEHPPTLITSYPTPVGREVEGAEAHFQLKGGRVAVVELDHLLARFENDARTQARKLRVLTDLTSTVGPIGGFRLRYRLERFDTSTDVSLLTGHRQQAVRLTEWELLPVASDMGETIDEALAPNSQFADAMGRLNPTQTVVTLWTYPDSFELFRQLRAMLYEEGYSVAARPLPAGERIAGSPSGTKSVAQ